MRVATAFLSLMFLLSSVSSADDVKEMEKRLAELDAEIEKVAEANKTALGAARLEELREARAKLAASVRKSKLKANPKAAKGTPALSDLDKLIERARTGDVKARAELIKLKGRIDKAVQQPVNMPPFLGGMGRGQIIINNGAVIGLGGVRRAVPNQPAPNKAAEEPKKVAPQPVTPEELDEHQERAAALEKQVVEMTRKVLELEQRLRELRAKVAEASNEPEAPKVAGEAGR